MGRRARAEMRAWFSEFAGTAILLFGSVALTRWLFGPGSHLAAVVTGIPARMAIDGAAVGIMLTLLIVSPLGHSSGGHFNPAVSLTFWRLRALPGRDAAAYVLAQLAGSVTGVLLARAALGAVVARRRVDYAAIRPAAGWSGAAVLAGEALSLALLMAAVVMFMDRPPLARWTPAVVGAAVAVLIFVGGLTSGGSFNPARQFGPLLLAKQWTYLWAYLFGPVAGAAILVWLVRIAGLRQPLTCSLCGGKPMDLPEADLAAGQSPAPPVWKTISPPAN